ncbi:MAG: hypothetical protein AB7P04_10670 [Bacteriovoracia bacterium]
MTRVFWFLALWIGSVNAFAQPEIECTADRTQDIYFRTSQRTFSVGVLAENYTLSGTYELEVFNVSALPQKGKYSVGKPAELNASADLYEYFIPVCFTYGGDMVAQHLISEEMAMTAGMMRMSRPAPKLVLIIPKTKDRKTSLKAEIVSLTQQIRAIELSIVDYEKQIRETDLKQLDAEAQVRSHEQKIRELQEQIPGLKSRLEETRVLLKKEFNE